MSANTLAFPTPASLGSLDHYIQAVNRFPLLSAEQEVELGRRLQRDGDSRFLCAQFLWALRHVGKCLGMGQRLFKQQL